MWDKLGQPHTISPSFYSFEFRTFSSNKTFIFVVVVVVVVVLISSFFSIISIPLFSGPCICRHSFQAILRLVNFTLVVWIVWLYQRRKNLSECGEETSRFVGGD